MIDKSSNFLFGCKNLYQLSIHPFDFKKSELPEYKKLIELGKEIINTEGVQIFAEFLFEYQYRVGIWSSLIILEFGELDQNEIFEFSGTETIYSACLEKIEQNEINELSAKIIENKKSWTKKIKIDYNTLS